MESATSPRIATVERVFELFNRLPLDPVEREAGPVRERFRARAGVDLEHKGAAIYTFRGEKIARFEAFFDHETACREFGD